MVKGKRDKVFHRETEIAPVQDKQKTLQGQCSHMKKNAEFMDEQIIRFLDGSLDQYGQEGVYSLTKPLLCAQRFSLFQAHMNLAGD